VASIETPNLDESSASFAIDLLAHMRIWRGAVKTLSRPSMISADAAIIYLWNKSVVLCNMKANDALYIVVACKEKSMSFSLVRESCTTLLDAILVQETDFQRSIIYLTIDCSVCQGCLLASEDWRFMFR
jgi:hypothetical protein